MMPMMQAYKLVRLGKIKRNDGELYLCGVRDSGLA
jgi:hypothetical protein